MSQENLHKQCGFSDRFKSFIHRFTVDLVALLVLFFLSVAGIGISDFSLRYGFWYWVAMIPVFGVVSIFTGWYQARLSRELSVGVLKRQILHWLALLPALYLVYLFQQSGRMNMEDAGLVVLLILALTTFLAGVHFNWRFCILGVVLGLTAATAALVEEFFWILLLPVVGAAFILFFWRRRSN